MAKVHKSVGNGAAQREQSQIYLSFAEPASHLKAKLYIGTHDVDFCTLDKAASVQIYNSRSANANRFMNFRQ